MRLSSILAVLVLFLAIHHVHGEGVQRPDAPKQNMVVNTMANVATLSANFLATAKDLQLDYAVMNISKSPLYVVDVSISVTREGTQVLIGVPKVELAASCEVHLLSRLQRLDPRRRYAAPPSAYASLLEVGKSKKVSVSLPFPLIPTNLPPSRDVQEILCDRVNFTLGVIPASPSVPAAEQEVAGVKLWRLPIYEAFEYQQELKVVATVPNIRVLVNK